MKNYEALIIINPDLEEEPLKQAYAQITDIIKKYKGEIETTEEWGKRALYHEISKKDKAHFYMVKFKAEPGSIVNIKKEYGLSENVLRAGIRLQSKATEPKPTREIKGV